MIRITRDIKLDLGFWINFARNGNGKAMVLQQPTMLPGKLSTDASDWGMGGFLNGRFFSVKWDDLPRAQTHPAFRRTNDPKLWPDRKDKQKWDISYREQFAQWWAILLWGTEFTDRTLTWEQDNSSVVVANMRRMGATNPHHMKLLRQIYQLAAERNMRHDMVHVTSEANLLADAASRGNMEVFDTAREEWLTQNTSPQERLWTRHAPDSHGLMEQRAHRWMGTGPHHCVG